LIVVIDTNVWISALLFSGSDSVPNQALKRAVRDDTLATSEELNHEIKRVLREKSVWTDSDIGRQMETFQRAALVVKLRHNVHVCRDPKDDMFLECAVLANADVLVTGDNDLLSLGSYGGTRIITPIEYVELPL